MRLKMRLKTSSSIQRLLKSMKKNIHYRKPFKSKDNLKLICEKGNAKYKPGMKVANCAVYPRMLYHTHNIQTGCTDYATYSSGRSNNQQMKYIHV